MSDAVVTIQNPVEQFLRMDRIPHIWCPGCGIGTTVNSFANALIEAEIDVKNLAIVSGIGCTGPSPDTPSWTHSTPHTAARFRSPPA
jgi:pyruvate/2-oxoacid:ferredoxin oxidoreductase beta subunit